MDATEFSKIDTPDSFWEIIPRDVVTNIKFRANLHAYLTEDKAARQTYIEMGIRKPAILFDTALWTYNPRKQVGEQNLPFILRPQQLRFVEALQDAMENEHDLAVDKTRDEGATEVICKMLALYFWLMPDVYFLVGSRKEDLVDRSVEIKHGRVIGPHQTLMHKILYGLANLPAWNQLNISKKHLVLQNLDNNSMIEGESTNESFGAGNRATAVLVDEAARIEPDICQYIIDNVGDVSNTCIWNSTHFRWGAGHPYAKLLISNKIPVVELGYESNPEKAAGLYRSPEKDIVEIIDADYYKEKMPGLFTYTQHDNLINVNTLPNKYNGLFQADGGERTYGKPRSPWFDKEEARGRSRTDIAQNILRIPQGSADQFFDNETVQRIKSQFVREPDIFGDIKYNVINQRIEDQRFERGRKNSPFRWWGKLTNGRPDQKHNYVVACDISRGTGASNSVLAVLDVNTSELVGLYVDPYVDVTEFAELAVATCKWVGGIHDALLIWESNGPGDTFCNRVKKLGYRFVYMRTNESRSNRKRTKAYGWHSSPGRDGTKFALLGELDAALYESLKPEKLFQYIIVHDEALCNELLDYMFLGDRIDVGLSSEVMEGSGARFAHGDRVIAVGLTILGCKEQRAGNWQRTIKPPINSFQFRFNKVNAEIDKQKREARQFLY